jgi:DNA-binding response OmpR family regulator
MSDAAFTVLVVEDDDATRTFLADNLTADGYELVVAARARDALRLMERQYPDIAVVDVGLPDGSGLDLVRAVREADGTATRLDPGIPMLVLSSRTDELDRLRGLERGADDYMTKPFSYPELRARIGALLRRAERRRGVTRMRIGELIVDPAARDVHLGERRIALSQKEFALLRLLATDPGRVFTKLELLRSVWGYEGVGTTRTLDSHACRLRTKLGGGFVINVWGVGYRLVDLPLELDA